MRNAFADEITKIAQEDGRVVFLSGDIGNRLFDGIKENAPDRFLNCGVAEANMMGMAAGLALCGFRPVTYTITPFITTRCLEQIRVDLCYHNLPVVIVSVGGGLSYASLGATHHSCEDIGLLRLLPNMKVVCPADSLEVRQAIRMALKEEGPVYIRLGKKGEPPIHKAPPDFRIGKAIVLRPGSEVCLLSTGNMAAVALDAARLLERKGISAQVANLHTVKPLDEAFLEEVFARFPAVVTAEEHSRLGGLGGSVAEWLADHPSPNSLLCRIGTSDSFLREAGEQAHARHHFGLTAENIAESAARLLEASVRTKSVHVTR